MKNKKTGAINKEFISQNAIWLILVVLIIVMSIANPRFLSVNNMVTLLTGEACKESSHSVLCSVSCQKVLISPQALRWHLSV